MKIKIKTFIFLLNISIIFVLSFFMYLIYLNQQNKMVAFITDNIRKDLLDSSYIATKFLNETSKIYNLRPLFDRKVAKNILIKGFVLSSNKKILFKSGDVNLKIPKSPSIKTDIRHITLTDLLTKEAYMIPLWYYVQNKKYQNRLYVFLDRDKLKSMFQNMKLRFFVYYIVFISAIMVLLNYIVQKYLIAPLIKTKEFAKRNVSKPQDVKIIELIEINDALFSTFMKLDSIIKSLYHSTVTDYLTKLGNRKFLEKKIKKLILKKEKFAMVFIDLDNFKEINDFFGHNVGDEFIVKIANDLKKEFPGEEIMARIGGDEFVLVIKETDIVKIKKMVEKILKILNKKRIINKNEICTTASIGVALYPEAGGSFEELLKNADIAMYEAKYKGKNKFVIFNHELMKKLKREVLIKNALAKAIHDNEFFLVYQPKVDRDGRVVGCEALIRWKKGDKIVYPNEFIEIAEKSGMIYEIGKWVMYEVVRQMKEWENDDALKHISVAFNVSVAQFRNDKFIKDLVNIANKKEIDISKLEIEITESVFIENKQRALRIVKAIKHLGFKISLDDFGTGYSSFSALKDLKIDNLKIDKSFIDEVEDEKGRVYTKTIVEMAQNLGIMSIAEGVEKKKQFEILKTFEVDYFQGYYFAKPLNVKDFEKYVRLKAS